MAETRNQSLLELNRQLEEVRTSRAQHFEEQKLRNRNLEVQMQELKTILVNMSMNQRSPTSPLNEQSEPVDDYLGRFECAHHVLDEMPHSTNTIELVQIDESSEDGGEALFEVVNRIERDEDPSQILVPNEPNSAKESSVLVAHQVLDKMPSDLNHDLAAHQVLDEMPEFTDEIDLEIARVSSTEERYDLEVFGVSNLNYAKPLLLFKNEFADLLSLLNEMPAQEEIRMNYREVFCFDPGGEFLDLVDSKLCLFTADLDLRMLDQLQSHFVAFGLAHFIAASSATSGHETKVLEEDNSSYFWSSGASIDLVSFADIVGIFDLVKTSTMILTFDPGGECSMLTDEMPRFATIINELTVVEPVLNVWVFDPGGLISDFLLSTSVS